MSEYFKSKDTQMESEKLYHVEKKEIRRLSLRSFIEDIFHLIDIDKGLFYTLKEFLIHPRQAIRNYFGKERFVHANPFRTLAILATLSAFTALNSGYAEQQIMEFGKGAADGAEIDTQVEQIMQGIYTGIFEYFSLITFGFLPLMAAISYLFYKKSGFNFAEHLVINSALLLIPTLLFIVFTGLFGITKSQSFLFVYYIIAICYQVYFMTTVFYTHWLWSVLKGIFITFFQYLMMTIIGAIIVVFYIAVQADLVKSSQEPTKTEKPIPDQSLETMESSKGLVEEPK